MHLFIIGLDVAVAERLAPLLEQVEPLLSRLGEDVPVLIESLPPEMVEDVRASVRVDHEGVHIQIAPQMQVSAADLAHEVMHVLLDIEGYPSLRGTPDAGVIESWLLDGEVDRRVAAAGFDPTTDSDRDFARAARAKLRRWDEDRLLGKYIAWHTTATRLPALRAAWRARVRAQRRDLANLGDAVITALREGAALHSADSAVVAMRDACDRLQAAGLRVGNLGYAGPEFEALRVAEWPERLTRLLAAVADQEAD